LAGWLAGWLLGWLAGWLVGRSVGWLVGLHSTPASVDAQPSSTPPPRPAVAGRPPAH
jgi:hypothetical protein